MQFIKITFCVIFITFATSVESRFLKKGKQEIHVVNYEATAITIGFSAIQSAKTYKIYAKEWINSTFEQEEPTSEKEAGQHERTVRINKLVPARQYLIQIMAFGKLGKQIGLSEKLAKTNLRCYVCNSKNKNSKCNKKSNIRSCPTGMNACLNEVRTPSSDIIIMKRCGQIHASVGGFESLRQCLSSKDDLCACTCKSDLCNKMLACQPRCGRQLKTPKEMSKKCSNGDKIGSVCSWKCNNEDHQLTGTSFSVCRRDRTWSLLTPPKCIPVEASHIITPEPKVKSPQNKNKMKPKIFQPSSDDDDAASRCPLLRNVIENGKVNCTDDNKFGSTCTALCFTGYEPGYFADKRTCRSNRVWTGKTLQCQKAFCEPLDDVKMKTVCTNGYKVGSICDIFCLGNLKLKGSSKRTCLRTAEWSGTKPRCIRRDCKMILDGAVGLTSSCKLGRNSNQVCSFSSEPGYKCEGDMKFRRCVDEKFDRPLPICKKLRCDKPESKHPNLVVRCTNQNIYQSNCTFSCLGDYYVSDDTPSECTKSGSWSKSYPTCKKYHCKTLPEFNFKNVTMQCSDDYNIGSECNITCRHSELHPDQDVSSKLSCVRNIEGVLQWKGELYRCLKQNCDELPEISGLVTDCDGHDFRAPGTICQHSCDEGYHQVKTHITRCQVKKFGAFREGRLPRCKRMTCMEPNVPVVNGRVNCTDNWFTGSVCTSICDKGFVHDGPSSMICQSNVASWNIPRLYCKQKLCEWRELIKIVNKSIELDCQVNEEVIHAGQFKPGHICEVSCKTGYVFNGTVPTAKCSEFGNWILEDSYDCIDIDECSVENGGCEHTCENIKGSRTCSCDVDFQLQPDGFSCKLTSCEAPSSDDDHLFMNCSSSFLEIGTTCYLSCSPGYKMRNPQSTIKCVRSQFQPEWDFRLPICEKISCPEIGEIINGQISCDRGTNYMSQCVGRCDQGYEEVTSAVTECTHQGSWSNPSLICRAKPCNESETQILNGLRVCNGSDVFGTICNYTCQRGFHFSESSDSSISIKCESNGEWSSSPPACSAITCPRVIRNNSNIICTNTFNFQSLCDLRCLEGFQAVGFTRSVCTINSTWSRDLGSCKKVQCAISVDLENGQVVCSNKNYFQSECQFRCDSGFFLVGNQSTKCGSDHAWSSEAPFCKRGRCDQSRLDVENSLVTCTSGDLFESVCTISCKNGFKFHDKELVTDIYEISCQNSLEWTGYKPKCVQKKCSKLVEPNADIQCTDGLNVGSVCSLNCNTGYEVGEGASVVECKQQESWSSKLATCQKKKCSEAEPPEYGRIECTGNNEYGAICNFFCNEGFGLIGNSSTRCTSDGVYDTRNITCIQLKCSDDEMQLEFGDVVCTNHNYVGSICTYKCNNGFKLKKSSQKLRDEDKFLIECNKDQSWSYTSPTCEKQKCSTTRDDYIKATESGQVTCTDSNWFGSVCSLLCDVGHEVNGDETVDCKSDGNWSSSIGFCQKNRCEPVTQIKNGTESCSDLNWFGSVCQFVCDEGFQLKGPETLKCSSNKNWSSVPPRCESNHLITLNFSITADYSTEISCPSLTIENGHTVCTEDYKYGSKCEFECEVGYELVKVSKEATELFDPIFECFSNGSWSFMQTEMLCVRKQCSQQDGSIVKARRSGNVSCEITGLQFVSSCTIQCQDGYELIGNEVTKCSVETQWTPVIGYCQKLRCSLSTSFDNGVITCSDGNVFQSTCTFTCNLGYQLSGQQQTTCQMDKTFENEFPTCTKIQCPDDRKAVNGKISCSDFNYFSSKCQLQCLPGFEINVKDKEKGLNQWSSSCGQNGEWSAENQECVKKTCDSQKLKTKQNGKLECTDSNLYQSKCQLTCESGYEIKGEQVTSCQDTTEWSTILGECEKKRCQVLEKPTNGKMRCTDENNYQSNCSFGCIHGYRLIGTSKSICQGNGSFSSPPPTCEEIICNDLIFENTMKICSNFNKFASECTFFCQAGYQLTKESSRRAKCSSDGHWDLFNPPSCEIITCPVNYSKLMKLSGSGTILCSNHNFFNSICRVQCRAGFEVVGPTIMKCLLSGSWSDNLGQCKKKTCLPLFSPVNGQLICTNDNQFQSTCKFLCNEGYEIVGNNASVCQQDGLFDQKAPICTKKQCDPSYLENEFGSILCTDSNYFTSICRYNCTVGYEIKQEESSVTCLADGSWSMPKPTCDKLTCSFKDITTQKMEQHSRLSCTDEDNYLSMCELQCDVGYEVIGADVSTCTSLGEWNQLVGSCQKIVCPDLQTEANLNHVCTFDYVYESKCYFECNTGYYLEGNLFTECQLDKTWSSKQPMCKQIECDEIEVMNGNVKCSDSNLFDSVCNITCNTGFKLSTENHISTIHCTSSNIWSHSVPRCIKEVCSGYEEEFSLARSTGSVYCTNEDFFGSSCEIRCAAGLEVVEGADRTTCNSNLKWDKIGYCKEVRCEEFEQLEDGAMSCTNSNKFKSICNFECDIGFQINGSAQSVCLQNGRFSKPLPTCTKKTCSASYLDPSYESVRCSDSNFVGSICSFTCFDNFRFFDNEKYYEVTDSIQISCDPDGHWNRSLPICEPVTCPTNIDSLIEAYETGNVTCTEGNRVGSECSASCGSKERILGKESIFCHKNGSWSDEIGRCHTLECKSFDIPQNGLLDCEGDSQSTCYYKCFPGHHMKMEGDISWDHVTRGSHGNSISVLPVSCLSDNVVDLEPVHLPPCEKNVCPLEGWKELINGIISCTDSNKFQSECFWKCNSGFRLASPFDDFDSTSAIVKCVENGKWNLPEAPECVKVECDKKLLESDPHGETVCLDGVEYGSTCRFTCIDGFALDGINRYQDIKCGNDGVWDRMQGVCEEIECRILEAPENSRIICSDDNKFRSTCKVLCDFGYELNDPDLSYNYAKGIECRSDGEWCGVLPSCVASGCPEENIYIENGEANCSNGTSVNSICKFSCHPGFSLQYMSYELTSTCQLNASWSSSSPICAKIKCSAESLDIERALQYGEVTCTNGNNFMSQCVLDCFSGYEIVGNSKVVCLSDGSWSSDFAFCDPITCEDLEPSLNSLLACSNHFFAGSSCLAECEDGYQVYGEVTEASCLASGEWAGVLGICEKIFCSEEPLSQFENGILQCSDDFKYQSRCTFKCKDGFQLSNFNESLYFSYECQSDGSWDHSRVPQCKRIKCPVFDLESVINGRLDCNDDNSYESTCKLICDKGFEVDGNYTWSRCTAEGTWWPKMASCKKIECSVFESPPNTFIRCLDGNRYRSICYFVGCQAGYETPTGRKNFVMCESDSRWKGSISRCQIRKCDESALMIDNGKAFCSRKNQMKSRCTYKCDDGYMMAESSSPLSVCCFYGSWSSAAPTCKKTTGCSSLTLSYGKVSCDTEGNCTVLCERGSYLVGPSQVKCHEVNGSLVVEPKLGTCEKNQCLPPVVPKNTIIDCSDSYFFRSNCYTKCANGFTHDSNIIPSIQCTSSGKWVGSIADCKQIVCPVEDLDIPNSNFALSDSNHYESTATYQCVEGFRLEGPNFRKCQINKLWSKPIPNCKQISCPTPLTTNGKKACFKVLGSEDYLPGTFCAISCDVGYKLTVSRKDSIFTCLRNGSWSGPMPLCKRVCDQSYLQLNNGNVECSDSSFVNSTCRYSCNSNSHKLEMFGANKINCDKSGDWSEIKPCCAKPCPSMSNVDLFFLLESNPDMGYDNWKRVLRFVEDIVIKFRYNRYGAMAGILRFHREVDFKNELRIGEAVNLATFLRHLKFMPYGGVGSNSRKVVESLFMSTIRQPGNRRAAKDYVIVITHENKEMRNILKEFDPFLRYRQIQVISVNTGDINFNSTLSKISENHDHFEALDQNQLTEDLASDVIKSICRYPCQ